MRSVVCLFRHSGCVLALLILLASGCMRIPRQTTLAPQIQMGDLARHVEFLAQPNLKGRKCRSVESGYVRQYIRQHFEAYGLKPWGRSHGYDLSFGLGTNVVGVRPGRDPRLRDEFILVSVHYDGPGVQGGKIRPAAGEGAAGMAALLEIAERLTANSTPRRSVAFAAFDCSEERYLGAFAFTTRSDFDPSKIAAVIHLDMLGRPLFDVVDNTLLEIGTSRHPEVRQIVQQEATAAGLRVFPIGSDLAGPVSDHYAFEQWPLPAILLTNGLYSDYHKPGDTPDKLDFALIERVTKAATQIVRELADRDTIGPAVEPTLGDREELQAIITLLQEIRAAAAANQLTPAEVQMLDRVIQRAQQLLAKDVYTVQDRERFIAGAVEQGAASVVRFLYDTPKPDPHKVIAPRQMTVLLRLQDFFARHRAFASQAQRQVVRHFVESRGNIFRLLGSYTYTGCDIRADEIHYTKQDDGAYRLSFYYPQLMIKAGWTGRDFRLTYDAVDFRGSASDALDLLLVTWSDRQNDCMARVMPRVLFEVTGENHGTTYQEWLAWRLQQTGAADEAAWLRGLWTTKNPMLLKALLARAAGQKLPEAPIPTLVSIITDRDMRTDVRADAIRALPEEPGHDILLVLIDLLADRTPTFRWNYLPAFDPSFPFHDRTAMQMARRSPERHDHSTLGQVANRKLTAITGEDFGQDRQAWLEWIGEHH